jgi:hypothetical protein
VLASTAPVAANERIGGADPEEHLLVGGSSRTPGPVRRRGRPPPPTSPGRRRATCLAARSAAIDLALALPDHERHQPWSPSRRATAPDPRTAGSARRCGAWRVPEHLGDRRGADDRQPAVERLHFAADAFRRQFGALGGTYDRVTPAVWRAGIDS